MYASGESNSNQIELPLHSTGRYNFTVDWGDGTQSAITSYDQARDYPYLRGRGRVHRHDPWQNRGLRFPAWRVLFRGEFLEVVGDSAKLLDVQSWGPVKLHSHGGQFLHAKNLGGFTATDTLDLSNVTTMSWMFYNARAFNQDISSWNVNGVRYYVDIFSGATMMNRNSQYKPPRFR